MKNKTEIYEIISTMENGYSIVKRDQKYGLIDRNGELIIPFEYEEIGEFVDDFVVASKCFHYETGRVHGCQILYGCIDKKENIIIPFEYQKIYKLVKNIARAIKNNKWGYINKQGKTVISFDYEYIDEFTINGIAKAKKNDKYGYIDEKEKIVIPFDFYEIGEFIDGKAKAKKDDKYGFIDMNGNIIIPFEYDEIEDFITGTAKARKNFWDEWGKIDENGNQVIENKIELQNGLVIGEKFGKWGVELKDKIVIPYEYDFIGQKFIDGKTGIFKNGNIGLINDIGEIITPLEYKKIKIFKNGIAIACKHINVRWHTNNEGDDIEKHDICYGCIDENGYVIIPFEYKFIGEFIDGKARAKNDKGNWGLIDSKNNIIIPFNYKGICRFKNGLYKVKSNQNNFGFLNEKGDVIIPVVYSRIGRFFDGKTLACLANNGKMKFGYLDDKGKVIIPFEYEKLSYFTNGLAIAQRKCDMLIIDEQNNEVKIKDSIQFQFEYTTREKDFDGLIEYEKHNIVIEINILPENIWECYVIEDGEKDDIHTYNLLKYENISLDDWGSEVLENAKSNWIDSEFFGGVNENINSSYERDMFNELTQGTYGDYEKWREDGGDLATLNAELGY